MKGTSAIILRILDAARPIGASERVIARVLKDVALPSAHVRVRAELRALADAGLVEIRDDDGDEDLVALGIGGWSAKLTLQGQDLVRIAKRVA